MAKIEQNHQEIMAGQQKLEKAHSVLALQVSKVAVADLKSEVPDAPKSNAEGPQKV